MLYLSDQSACESGGIGRHAGLKLQCLQKRVGSSPTFRTIILMFQLIGRQVELSIFSPDRYSPTDSSDPRYQG